MTLQASLPARLSCEIDLISICGPVREENQDAGVAWRGAGGEVVLIVADGMGGHDAGRVAAETTVRACLESIRNRTRESWQEVLESAIGAAHASVLATVRAGEERRRPGATVALAVITARAEHPSLHVAHVGDSRVYLYRGRSLYRLTTDHSLVARMVHDGLLREEEAWGHPDSNVIQRAIGQAGPLQPEVQAPVELDAGDVVLLCSDGLHGALPDPEIAAALGPGGSAHEICARLLAAALAAGSQDNVTIGCARLAGETRRRPTRVQRGARS